MVELASLPYPLAAFISHKAQIRPKKLTIQSSIRVSKLTKRKNYLRLKILKTLTKPYPIPSPTPEDPVTPIEIVEPSIEAPCEPTLENLDSGIVEQSEILVSVDESSSGQIQVAQVSEAQNVVGFSWFSGRMVVRIVASFVGLFVLQTVVAVWVMGPGGSDEKKDRNLKIEGEHLDPRLPNGNAFQENLAYMNVDDSEIEAKIAEIRKLAREAREIEKRSIENGEADTGDVSDDDEDDGLQAETSRIRSGIVKEVDGRLTKLRKKSPTPLLNVNISNKPQELVKEAKNEGLEGKEENNTLMFEIKPKFRSNLTAPRDKPKGFQSIKGSRDIREKHRNMDNEQPTKKAGNLSGSNASPSNEDQEINGLDSSFPERSSAVSQIDEKKPGSQSSSPLQNLKKKPGNNSGTRKLNKGSSRSASSQASKKTSGSNSSKEKLNNRINEDAKNERGVVQDSSHGNPVDQAANSKDSSTIATQNSQMKVSDLKTSTKSEMHTVSEPLSSDKHGNALSKDKQQNGDPSSWWLSLPYALVILMRKSSEGEGMEGFYTLRVYSDTQNQPYTPYIVAFEARNDARNFSYLLESVFEDLPDASIDVVPLPTKELKQVAESLENKVIVVKKGELELYAGQPLAEVDTALRSLVN